MAARAAATGQTNGRSVVGTNRLAAGAKAPTCTAWPEGKESQALPDFGIPCRGPCTRERSGRSRATKRLNRCGTAPAIATATSIRAAVRRNSRSSVVNRTAIHDKTAPTTRSFSSASNVTIRKGRSSEGLARRAQASDVATSKSLGGRSIKAFRDIASMKLSLLAEVPSPRRSSAPFAFGS